MVALSTLPEYLDEIRAEVCSRCIERPQGGPPCAPLGKVCGVEFHLAEMVESIRSVPPGRLIEPYLDHNREHICRQCQFLHADGCPCPMETLLVLVAQAVEAVDERRQAAAGR